MGTAAPRFCRACGAPLAGLEDCAECGTTPAAAPDEPLRRVGTAKAAPRRSRRARDHPWQVFLPILQLWLGLLAISLGVGVIGHALDWGVLAELVAAAGFVVLVFVFYWRDRRHVDPLLCRLGLDDRTWWLPFAALAILAPFMWGYFAALEFLGAEILSETEDHVSAGWPIWLMFLMGAVVPALTEEVAFRGIIQRRLGQLMRSLDALLVQGVLFSVLHLAPLNFVSHFVMGVAFGWLRWKTGSLWPSICVHAIWNGSLILQELTAVA